MTKFVCLLVFLAPLCAIQAGCGSIEEKPHSSVNSRIETAIVDAGGDPSDWVFSNDCVIAGSCTATIARVSSPKSVIAYNRYLVKDSRATLKGSDRIKDAVEQAVK